MITFWYRTPNTYTRIRLAFSRIQNRQFFPEIIFDAFHVIPYSENVLYIILKEPLVSDLITVFRLQNKAFVNLIFHRHTI